MSRLVSAEELLVLLTSNTTLIFVAKILVKLFFSNLLMILSKRSCFLRISDSTAAIIYAKQD